ncbi:MAG TPA: hypothetical protein VFG85_08595 [Gaiellaceae bacterium]|jgi:hypothetical protein|nr:hypothetical protein [Gaiellaceae bacterium]
MRRTIVVIFVAALAMWAADASYGQAGYSLRTPGAELIELRTGYGRAVIGRRGSVLIRVSLGRIRVVDLPGGGRPNRSCNKRGVRVSRSTMQYSGSDVRCRVWSGSTGGPWQAVITGRRISAAGSARGSLTLDAYDTGPRGRYRIAGGALRYWPRTARTFELWRR